VGKATHKNTRVGCYRKSLENKAGKRWGSAILHSQSAQSKLFTGDLSYARLIK
jgi:hypothetical protein